MGAGAGEAIRRQAFPGQGQMKPEQAEIARLREGSGQAQDGARHPEKSRGLLREGVDVKFGFVAKHRGIWPVGLMCEALGVSRGGFYAWLDTAAEPARAGRRRTGRGCKQSFLDSDRTYGCTPCLARPAGGWAILRPTSDRTAHAGRGPARPPPAARHAHGPWRARSATADNVLDRQFQADRANQKWVADFTYLWTAEGWLYVAVVLDLFSRRVVGWSMQARMTTQLVTDALMMAIWRRGKPEALLHHSDRAASTPASTSSGCWPTTA